MSAVVPIVPARDVPLAVAWYCEKLGFHAVHVEPEYGIVQRDALELHFWGPTDVAPEHSDYMYRVQVDGIDELYDDCRERDIVHPNAPLEERAWGTREFGVIDRDGNLVTFFEPMAQVTPLEREFPNLFQVLGGYLHQDWDVDFETPDDALRAARAGQGSEQIRGAIAEIEELLAANVDDDAVDAIVRPMTGGYDPKADGRTARQWLRHVREVLEGAE